MGWFDVKTMRTVCEQEGQGKKPDFPKIPEKKIHDEKKTAEKKKKFGDPKICLVTGEAVREKNQKEGRFV